MNENTELMDVRQIREAFVWLYANGYEKEVETILHDIQELVSDSLVLKGYAKPSWWYVRADFAAKKVFEMNKAYCSATGKNFARFCHIAKAYDVSNFMREIALALIWGSGCTFEEELPDDFPEYRLRFRANKSKIRSAFAWLKDNEHEEVVNSTIYYIKRAVEIAISMNYPSNLEKRTNKIRKICTRIHWMKKTLRKNGFEEYYFRKVEYEENGNKDMRRYVEEIARAIVWDYEDAQSNSDLQNQHSELSMSETI